MNWIEPDWPVAKNIHAAVTLRTGGVSQGAFNSLNPALHVNDDSKRVLSNRKTIVDMLNLPADPVWLEQIHSNQVVNVDKFSKKLIQADASYTHQPNIVCGVLTADCLPILLSASSKQKPTKVAAIHAGWRGLLSGIISQTITVFNESDIIAWLGPAIGPNCFEVGHEVQQMFVNKSNKYSAAFKQKNKDKFLADIYKIAKIELASQGVSKVYGGDLCTFTDSKNFYSYRRDGETGRMATLIWRD